jgi:N-methylhydantoinase A
VKTGLVGVDVGGTFTDVVAIDNGKVVTTKVLTDPDKTETSVLKGAEEAGVGQAHIFNLATTAGLNAVITRRLPKVAFLTTAGHRDMLDRGRVARPLEALTDPGWRRGFSDVSRPLVPRYLRRGISERLRSDGQILAPLDEQQAREELAVLRDCDVDGVAICLLHSWINPVHEQRLGELVAEVLGDVVVSLSSDVSPLAREYPRASTTTIDVFMKLIYGRYTEDLATGLRDLGFEEEFNYADCAATLLPASYAMKRPHQLVIAGPAAGAVAAAHFGSLIGQDNLLCADIGGTSCDISMVAGGKPWMNDTVELEWDLVVNALSVEVVTLGAGGGSVVAVGKAGELQVGPDSAGSHPGPACYGLGGTRPTLTDAALLMGILTSVRFLGGTMPLDEEAALASFEQLPGTLPISDRVRYAWTIGLQNIAEGIIDITVRRGVDPRDFSLLAFGAAGPMLLPMLLDQLPMKSVIVPPYPGEFCAAGLLSSDHVFTETVTRYGILHPDAAQTTEDTFTELERALIARAGVDRRDDVRVVRTFDARLYGQGWETPFIPVPEGPIDGPAIAAIIEAFHTEYAKRNGNRFDMMPVEGVTYRVQLILPSEKMAYPQISARAAAGPAPIVGTQRLRHLYADEVDAASYERADLGAGDLIEGPAIIWEPTSTTFVPAARRATVGSHGEIVIT